MTCKYKKSCGYDFCLEEECEEYEPFPKPEEKAKTPEQERS